MKITEDQIRKWLEKRNLQDAMFNDQVKLLTEFANTDFLVPPKPKQPHSKVAVWDETIKNGQTYHNLQRIKDACWRYDYTFNGLPDIDRVIKETLDEGALAVRIECDENFGCKDGFGGGIYLWDNNVDLNYGWPYSGYRGWWAIDVIEQLESAVIAYCKEQSAKQSKQPLPKFEVGDKVWWSGKSNLTYVYPKQEASIIGCDYGSGHPYEIRSRDRYNLELWVPESSLSPLPEMYVGKVWTLEQDGNPWDDFLCECVREDTRMAKFEQLYHERNNKHILDLSYYPAGTEGHVISSSYFIIQCIDPEFWTGILCGERVRCYEDEHSNINIFYEGAQEALRILPQNCDNTFVEKVWLDVIKKAGIHIAPFGYFDEKGSTNERG